MIYKNSTTVLYDQDYNFLQTTDRRMDISYVLPHFQLQEHFIKSSMHVLQGKIV